MKRVCLLILTLIIGFNLYAAGEAGGLIFEMATGARQASMAGVFIAKADDVNTIFYNPAGLANIGSYELGLTYDNNVSDIRNAMITFAIPVEKIGSFGVGIIYSFVQGDVNNAIIEEPVKVYDLAGILGYSYAFTKEFLAGINLKFLKSQLGDYSTSAFAFDIGALYYLNNYINIGAAVQNIGTGLKFDIEETRLPVKAGVGINYEALKTKEHLASISSDIKYNIVENEVLAGIGLEYFYNNIFSARAGYILEQQSLNSFTLGAGVKSVLNNMVIKFDYAFLPKIWQNGDFDFNHIVTIRLNF